MSAQTPTSDSATPRPLQRSLLFPEPELPPAQEVIAEGLKLGRQISPVRSTFHKHYDVTCEAEYKRRRVAEGKTMFHAQIGFRDPDKTRRACAEVYEALDRIGYRVDRFGMTFDRNMGYSPEARKDMPKGTGLIFDSIDDWHAVTSSAPVASHYGDLGPMVYGATTLYTANETANRGALSHYLSFDIAAQTLAPSGHAVTAVPITEYERIPDTDEIIEVQIIANRLAELAENSIPLIDDAAIDAAADKLIEGGRHFKNKLFHDLCDAGIDTDNALELLLVIRRLGARELETRFGPASWTKSDQRPPSRPPVREHAAFAGDRREYP